MGGARSRGGRGVNGGRGEEREGRLSGFRREGKSGRGREGEASLLLL